MQVYLPPLGGRREDIPLLVRHLVERAADRSPAVAKRFVETDSRGVVHARVDAELVDALVRRDYPRNTRELDSVLWAAMSASDTDTIGWHPSAAPASLAMPEASTGAAATRPTPEVAEGQDAEKPTSWGAGRSSEAPPRTRNQEPSEDDIREALAHADGNVARAAAALGLSSRYALYRVMAKLGIELGR